MSDDEIWTVEERFWIGGIEHYRLRLDPQCLLAFPAPAGIITGSDVIANLDGAPRWSSVVITDRHFAEASADVVVLAYLAEGERPGAARYRAYCSSTYIRSQTQWRLVQHQQTPL